MVQGGKAGKISKPYGLQGEVQVFLNPLIVNHIEIGNPLFIDIDGQRVPFFLEDADILSGDQAILKFEFINTVEEARKVCGCTLFLDPKHVAGEASFSDDPAGVVGYVAVDTALGELGPISAYYHHKSNPVWGIFYQGREILVPVQAGWIVKQDHRKKKIHLSLPEGLTEV